MQKRLKNTALDTPLMIWNEIWNGRKKSEWNMEWLKYGMEDLMYGMEQIFHIPYKFHTCTF